MRPANGSEALIDELSSRDRRSQKEDLLPLARTGQVDQIAFVRLDRWGRSMDELVVEPDKMRQRKVTLISLREGLRFDDAAGMLFAHMLVAFANFGRGLIRERTAADLYRARSEGKIGGRPPAGCGSRPDGKPSHDGPVQLVRDGKQPIKWVWPDGRELLVRSNLPRPDGGLH